MTISAKQLSNKFNVPSAEELQRAAEQARAKLLQDRLSEALRSPEALEIPIKELLEEAPGLGDLTLAGIFAMTRPSSSAVDKVRTRLSESQVNAIKAQLTEIFAAGYKGSRSDLASKVSVAGIPPEEMGDKLRLPLKSLIESGHVTTEGEKRLMVYVTAKPAAKKVTTAAAPAAATIKQATAAKK